MYLLNNVAQSTFRGSQIVLASTGSERGDSAREDGQAIKQNRDSDTGQTLHHGFDKHSLRHERGRQTLQVSRLVCSCVESTLKQVV